MDAVAPELPPTTGRDRVGRLLLGVGGVGLASVGVVGLVREQDLEVLVRVTAWVVGPVLVHDLVIAPVVLLLAWLVRLTLPRWTWGPMAGGLISTGGLSVLALTVVGRPGALPNNPSLLDRDYTAGFAVSLLLVWTVVAVVLGLRARARRVDPPG